MKTTQKVVRLVRPEEREAEAKASNGDTMRRIAESLGASEEDTMRRIAETVDAIEEVVSFIRNLPQHCEFLAERIGERIAAKVGEDLTKPIYSIQEVANQLGVSKRTIESMLAREDCPFDCVRVGARRVITAESIERFIGAGGDNHGVN